MHSISSKIRSTLGVWWYRSRCRILLAARHWTFSSVLILSNVEGSRQGLQKPEWVWPKLCRLLDLFVGELNIPPDQTHSFICLIDDARDVCSPSLVISNDDSQVFHLGSSCSQCLWRWHLFFSLLCQYGVRSMKYFWGWNYFLVLLCCHSACLLRSSCKWCWSWALVTSQQTIQWVKSKCGWQTRQQVVNAEQKQAWAEDETLGYIRIFGSKLQSWNNSWQWAASSFPAGEKKKTLSIKALGSVCLFGLPAECSLTSWLLMSTNGSFASVLDPTAGSHDHIHEVTNSVNH